MKAYESSIADRAEMDVGKLILKLEPLLPERTARWRRVMDLADADAKVLLEKEILQTAYKLLGDFRRKPLLSLPPPNKARGAINLGTIVYEAEKWGFGLTQPELLRNMGIFGMSGSGKTNVAFHILRQLVQKRIHFLFWDWKRTVRHLIPSLGNQVDIYTPGRSLSPLPFNPFIVPPGLEPRVYLNHVVDVMSDAYTLGDGSRRVLQKALGTCYERSNGAPTVSEVREEVERFPATERVRGWKISALRAVESLVGSSITASETGAQLAFARELLDRSTVIELDALDQGSKKFLIPMMCLWLYYVQLSATEREKLRLVVFVEEAHHVLYRNEQRAKESLLNMLLRQCREIGLGMVIIDQHPHLISTAALGNAYTTICFNQRDPSDINKAAGLSLISDTDKRFFSVLPVGHAIVKLQDRWRRPFLIKVPLVDVRKGLVTDELLGRFVGRSLSITGLKREVERAARRARRELTSRTALDQASLDFVEDVLQHGNDGIRERYKRMRLSADKGNRIKSSLVRQGVLEERQVKVGRTYRVLLRVTPEATYRLGFSKSRSRGSVAHEYWKRYHAARLKREGYHVELEAARRGGRADVVARMAGRTIAVEVETGKSDAVQNVRNALLSGFGTVVLVATDEGAFHKVERQLAAAGLLLPKRVELVLREGVFRVA